MPCDIDRTFWEVLDVDHGKLLRNAVLWATAEPSPITVKGPGVLDVSVWTQKDSMTVHLVNLTNPMMMKGPVREIIPIPGPQVAIRIPSGKTIRKVHLLGSRRRGPLRPPLGRDRVASTRYRASRSHCDRLCLSHFTSTRTGTKQTGTCLRVVELQFSVESRSTRVTSRVGDTGHFSR